MSMMKKYLRLSPEDFLLLALIPAGGLLLLEICTGIGNALSSQHSIIIFGGLVMPMIACGLAFFTSAGHIISTYEQSVKLGRTRRETIPYVLFLCLLEGAFTLAVSWLMCLLEEAVADHVWPLIFPDAEREDIFLHMFSFRGVAIAAVVCVLAGFAMGALLHRFGKKAFWIIWGLWMAFFLTVSNINHDWLDHIVRTVGIDLFPVLLVSGGVLLAGVLCWSIWYLLHAAVKT